MSGRKVHEHLMMLKKTKIPERSAMGKISYTSLDKYDKRSLESSTAIFNPERPNQNEFSLPKKTGFNQKTEFQ